MRDIFDNEILFEGSQSQVYVYHSAPLIDEVYSVLYERESSHALTIEPVHIAYREEQGHNLHSLECLINDNLNFSRTALILNELEQQLSALSAPLDTPLPIYLPEPEFALPAHTSSPTVLPVPPSILNDTQQDQEETPEVPPQAERRLRIGEDSVPKFSVQRASRQEIKQRDGRRKREMKAGDK